MSERKVLNKYYPPDYDPSLIPKLRLAKDRQYVIRVMAPFHMRCKTCGNYIYKGTKFNSRKETVQDDDYLGLRIFRFYIKCTKCVAEITFKTDPENQDYAIEHGATRNFEAEKLLEKQEKEIQRQKEEDEGNPMKLLEMRTRDSKREMERMENLEELRDLNQRKAKVNYEGMLQGYRETEEERKKRETEEDEKELKAIFGQDRVKRLNDDDSDEEVEAKRTKIEFTSSKAAEQIAPSSLLLTAEPGPSKDTTKKSFLPSSKNVIKKKAAKLGIVKKKTEGADKSDSNGVTSNSSNAQQPASSPCAEALVAKKATNNTATERSSSPKSALAAGGLSLLGGYGSDQSSTSEDDD